MTKCELNRIELTNFLSSFGPGIEDLRLNVSENSLVGGVATSTHFLTKKITVTQTEGGTIVVADLGKVLAFLRACADDTVELHQQDRDGTLGNLRLSCGNSIVNLPPTKEVKSAQSLATATKLVEDAGESNWTKWVDCPLNCYGVVEVSELAPVSALGKVVGADKPYHLSFIASNNEAVIHTGSSVSGQMFHKVSIKDADGPNGEEDVVKTSFGPWFPDVLSCLPAGKTEVYTGDSTVLVFNHQDKHCLLVVIDQDLAEE